MQTTVFFPPVTKKEVEIQVFLFGVITVGKLLKHLDEVEMHVR